MSREPFRLPAMIQENKVLVFDIDGTLTTDRADGQHYSDVGVNEEVLTRLQELKQKGYWIVLYTSRNMRSHSGNIGLIIKHTAPILIEWLDRHHIPYDELHFGKPWCGHDGFYVDDRAIRPREFVELNLDQIDALLKRDRFTS
jgi:capsule biosynthesis phosphatase